MPEKSPSASKSICAALASENVYESISPAAPTLLVTVLPTVSGVPVNGTIGVYRGS